MSYILQYSWYFLVWVFFNLVMVFQVNMNSGNLGLVKACLVAGLYPNLARYSGRSTFTFTVELVMLIPSVVDPNTMNLDPDPEFCPNFNPDPGLCYEFVEQKFKVVIIRNKI